MSVLDGDATALDAPATADGTLPLAGAADPPVVFEQPANTADSPQIIMA